MFASVTAALALLCFVCTASNASELDKDAAAATLLAVPSTVGLNETVPLPLPRPPSSQAQWFWAGGAIDSAMLRLETIPNRTYYASDGQTVQRPIDALTAAGFNAIRVQTSRRSSSDPTSSFDNSGNFINREMNFLLDFGNIDISVLTAGLAKERGMKVQLTINMGADIPPEWQQYNYQDMLGAITGEVQRQLQPFLQAGIQPDIILFETEDSVGLLYKTTLPNGETHTRGTGGNPSVSAEQVRQELCGAVPTGHYLSYPQLAGYYKQEIIACNEAIASFGFDPALTRYGLHSQLKYIDWRHSFVYSTNPDVELAINRSGVNCSFQGVIPDYLLQQRASDMLTIMGFSSYPIPIRPVDVTSTSSLDATFTKLRGSLSLMNDIALRYGKYTSGPFAGQYMKQGLAVEYASQFSYPSEMQAQQQHTAMYFQTLQAYPWLLGAMWWAPTWVFNNWMAGKASLYHRWYSADGVGTNAAPTPTLAYWGSFARSP